MKKRSIILTFAMLCMTLLFCVSAQAAAAHWENTADGRWVFVTKKGKVYEGTYFPGKKAGIVNNGRYSYCFKANGKKFKGMFKNGSDWYYFQPKTGRMTVNAQALVKGKTYYFRDDGIRVKKTWVGRRYYGKNGVQVFNRFVGQRYVGEDGLFVTGLTTINGKQYYFDKLTGYMAVSTTVEIDGQSRTADASGVLAPLQTKSPSGVTVETTYFTDPKVNDQTLLSAIIYCEAGNQPYYGQLAVGLVIMNRVRSSQFPNTLKEVLYADQQFEPCRNGWMTNALCGKIKVSDSCKKAANEAISRYRAGKYKIKTEDEKIVNMKGYLFFMTPGSFERLRLVSPHIVLKGHVFFKNWVR